MDQIAMVTLKIESGHRLIDELSPSFPIAVAFWAKLSEEGKYSLYLASPAVENKSSAVAYQMVHRVIRGMPWLGIDPIEVKLIRSNNPMAQAAIAITEQKFANGPFAVANPTPFTGMTEFDGGTLGGVSIDYACIYPPQGVFLPSV